MPKNVQCPNCKRFLQASDAYAGEVRCPECQTTFAIGVAASSAGGAGRPEASESLQPGEPMPSRTRATSPDVSDEIPSQFGESQFEPSPMTSALAKVALGACIFTSLVMAGSEYFQMRLADRMIAGELVPENELTSNDFRHRILGIINTVAFVFSAVCFLIWFHQAHTNLKALGVVGLTYTSGWAVGCWFVPILNFYRPVQIAQEIWRQSDPAMSRSADSAPSSPLIGMWWVTWMASNVIGYMRCGFRGERIRRSYFDPPPFSGWLLISQPFRPHCSRLLLSSPSTRARTSGEKQRAGWGGQEWLIASNSAKRARQFPLSGSRVSRIVPSLTQAESKATTVQASISVPK